MSRIGIKPITIPAGVEVTVEDGNVVKVKGPKGELSTKIGSGMKVIVEEGTLRVERADNGRENRSQHGLARTLIDNMVTGVTNGFEKKLQIVGVGYSAAKQGSKLVLKLGYSHPIELEDPEGITTETPDANTIVIKGIDKALVGNYAANIRAWRAPEPYKGKGILYAGEVVHKKEGKSGASRNDRRLKRHARVRKHVFGTPEKPRMCVFRSNANISVQIIDDVNGKTLVSASSLDKDLRKEIGYGGNKEAAAKVGKAIAEKATEKGIKEVCFDRGGYLFHGRVKELADAAREAGLDF